MWTRIGIPMCCANPAQVVAEKPGILERVLVTKQPSAKGVYQVMLFSAGEWEPILLDDTFPCSIDGRLAYTSASRNQFWAPLIEKAAASLYGSYEALQAGSISEGLRMLTGSPCETVYLDTSSTEAKVAEQSLKCVQTAYDYLTIGNSSAMDDLWIKISSAHAKGCLMGASTKFDCSTRQGLVAGHAYSVMNVWNPAGRRLICLRNPHGGQSWTGPWGAMDNPEWTAALKAQMPTSEQGSKAALEGVFWMPFPDFVQHFVTVDVCHIKRNWSSVRLEGKFPQTAQDFGTCFQVRAFQETALNITLTQTDLRGREHDSADAEPLDLGILVLYTKQGDHVRNSTLVGFSARRIHPSRMCETYLKHTSGTYIVIPISFNHFNYGHTGAVNDSSTHDRRCICDFHSANTLTIEAVTCPPDLLAHAVILQAIECGKCLQPFPSKDSMKLYELDSQFVVDNGSRKRSFATHLQVVAGDHYTSSRSLLECRDVVPPMHRQLICALTPIKKEMSSSVQYKMDFEMVQGKQAQAKSQPPISTADIHAAQPRACTLSKGTVLTLAGAPSPEAEVPYSKWENGGYVTSHEGAFGGSQKHTDESIDAMLQDFLALAGASSPAAST